MSDALTDYLTDPLLHALHGKASRQRAVTHFDLGDGGCLPAPVHVAGRRKTPCLKESDHVRIAGIASRTQGHPSAPSTAANDPGHVTSGTRR
jgi:hypothetical protein